MRQQLSATMSIVTALSVLVLASSCLDDKLTEEQRDAIDKLPGVVSAETERNIKISKDSILNVEFASDITADQIANIVRVYHDTAPSSDADHSKYERSYQIAFRPEGTGGDRDANPDGEEPHFATSFTVPALSLDAQGIGLGTNPEEFTPIAETWLSLVENHDQVALDLQEKSLGVIDNGKRMITDVAQESVDATLPLSDNEEPLVNDYWILRGNYSPKPMPRWSGQFNRDDAESSIIAWRQVIDTVTSDKIGISLGVSAADPTAELTPPPSTNLRWSFSVTAPEGNACKADSLACEDELLAAPYWSEVEAAARSAYSIVDPATALIQGIEVEVGFAGHGLATGASYRTTWCELEPDSSKVAQRLFAEATAITGPCTAPTA